VRHQIVFLDRASVGARLRRPAFDHIWNEYPSTQGAAETEARLKDASIAITNKVPLRRESVARLPKLKLIAMAATGYDVVDARGTAA
jgi:glycerate dehydrogenase